MKKILQKIKEKGYVPYEVRTSIFKNLDIMQIRNWLEWRGIDRHLPIELHSTEIAICTPEGVLMQIRACDNDALGMWGGCLECNETPIDGAVRELYEETSLSFPEEMLKFVDTYEHTHTYANGDSAIYHTYRFVINLNYIPEITVDEESHGFDLVNTKKDVKRVLKDQQEFILKLILK